MTRETDIVAVEQEIHAAVRAVKRDGIVVLRAEVRRLTGLMHGLGYDPRAVEISIKRFGSELQDGLDNAAKRRGERRASRPRQLALLAEINATARKAFIRLNRHGTQRPVIGTSGPPQKTGYRHRRLTDLHKAE